MTLTQKASICARSIARMPDALQQPQSKPNGTPWRGKSRKVVTPVGVFDSLGLAACAYAVTKQTIYMWGSCRRRVFGMSEAIFFIIPLVTICVMIAICRWQERQLAQMDRLHREIERELDALTRKHLETLEARLAGEGSLN